MSLSTTDLENILTSKSGVKFNAKFDEKDIEIEIYPENGFSHKMVINGELG
jgi:hypothetical protein